MKKQTGTVLKTSAEIVGSFAPIIIAIVMFVGLSDKLPEILGISLFTPVVDVMVLGAGAMLGFLIVAKVCWMILYDWAIVSWLRWLTTSKEAASG